MPYYNKFDDIPIEDYKYIHKFGWLAVFRTTLDWKRTPCPILEANYKADLTFFNAMNKTQYYKKFLNLYPPFINSYVKVGMLMPQTLMRHKISVYNKDGTRDIKYVNGTLQNPANICILCEKIQNLVNKCYSINISYSVQGVKIHEYEGDYSPPYMEEYDKELPIPYWSTSHCIFTMIEEDYKILRSNPIIPTLHYKAHIYYELCQSRFINFYEGIKKSFYTIC